MVSQRFGEEAKAFLASNRHAERWVKLSSPRDNDHIRDFRAREVGVDQVNSHSPLSEFAPWVSHIRRRISSSSNTRLGLPWTVLRVISGDAFPSARSVYSGIPEHHSRLIVDSSRFPLAVLLRARGPRNNSGRLLISVLRAGRAYASGLIL